MASMIPKVISIIFSINVLLAVFVVFTERRKPSSSWAWLLVLFFIPIFGFIMYLFIGLDVTKRQTFIRKTEEDIFVNDEYTSKLKLHHGKNYVKEQMIIYENGKKLTHLDKEFDLLNVDELAFMNLQFNSWMTYNNSMIIYSEGISKFTDLINDIKNSKKFLHIFYYIWRDDVLGRLVLKELGKAAKRGIEVRVLHDGTGNVSLPKDFWDELIDSGGEVGTFLPPLLSRINFRNHRKLCVIDGTIGYIGGFNIGDEYIGILPKFGAWRDTHMKVYGDCIDQLQLRFFMDWNFTSKNKLAFEHKYFPEKINTGDIHMQIVSSGPDTNWPNVQYGIYKMITMANESVFIETPYFVPDDSILEALRVSALSGIDVRIIIPGNPDHPFVYWASLSYLGDLIDAGVKCYQYDYGFLHSKVMIVDSKISTVGTTNMDIRSFKLNFEINAFIYDKESSKVFERDFLTDLKKCTAITKEYYEQRSFSVKIKESISRLISPLL